MVENKQENIIAEVNTFPDPDSGLIKENINLDLKENYEYSLKVRVATHDQSQTATSQKHIFSKFYSSFTLYSQLKPCVSNHKNITLFSYLSKVSVTIIAI